jgi:hypothetical protein
MSYGEKKITLVIDPLGRTKMEGHGFQGTECDAAMAPIEKALAGEASMQKEYKESWATDATNQNADLQQW